MSSLHQLLDLQQHDTLADQLRHRRASLPERTELVDARAQRTAAEQARATQKAARDALGAAQDRLETDISAARDRMKAVDATMYGGGITNARELQALQDEIASLKRRVTLLEDEELEVMEQLEPVDAAIAAADADAERLAADIERLEAAITTAEAEIDVELAANAGERATSAALVADPLLAEYEQLRSTSMGIAVAALVGGQCGGCHMRLSAVELDRIKKQPVDAIIHCEDCGRLLVR